MVSLQPRHWKRILATLITACVSVTGALATEGIDDPIHGYYTRPPRDRFSRLRAELAAGKVSLDPSSDLAFLRSVLDLLEVPVSSQMLVYSVTSLQKAL